ncbi:Spo0E like sporulation regulatory protein [Halobacillus alkaliphilus]|uniref:Spo0E like sporulation regulatory protein n=1 Tax=Halobacillus alkaliphilus TaxID=396056 RepID=A0A1I2JU57_9BACI|nr:Spo0E like sporulation regulatory protein [Halobacillus alkaliphilus]
MIHGDGGVSLDDREELKNRIEILREQLYAAYVKGMEYKELLKISQELDRLLNSLRELE